MTGAAVARGDASHRQSGRNWSHCSWFHSGWWPTVAKTASTCLLTPLAGAAAARGAAVSAGIVADDTPIPCRKPPGVEPASDALL